MKTTTLTQMSGTQSQAKQENDATAKTERQPSWDHKVSSEPIADGMRVLLVEDNEINLKLLVAYMRKLKLNHATACNGLEAVNTYKDAHTESRKFNVIFMGQSFPSTLNIPRL